MKKKFMFLAVAMVSVMLAACGSKANEKVSTQPETTQAEATTAQGEESATQGEESAAQGEESATQSEESTPAESGKKIVIGATGLQEDQFTQVLFKGYQDAANELGVDIIIANSQHSSETETTQIHNMLAGGAGGIIEECVNPETSAAIAEDAKASGAYVFACAIGLNSDAVSASGLNDCYDLGESTGEYAKEYFAENFSKDQEINVAIISYDGQDATGSGQRIDGFLDQLSDYNINIVSRQEGEVADKAYTVATDMLTANQNIDVFFCASENGVVGCVNAIEASGNPNNAVVFGVDCSEQLVEMMKADNNILQGVTAQDPYTLGQYAVKTVYNYLAEGKEPEEKDFHADCILLTRSDIPGCEEWLNTWNEYAK